MDITLLINHLNVLLYGPSSKEFLQDDKNSTSITSSTIITIANIEFLLIDDNVNHDEEQNGNDGDGDVTVGLSDSSIDEKMRRLQELKTLDEEYTSQLASLGNLS